MSYEFHLEVRTLLWVLWAFNSVLAIVLVVLPCRSFACKALLRAKAVQACAWFLLAMWGHVPDILSAALGSSLLVIGFALEVMALAGREGFRKSQRDGGDAASGESAPQEALLHRIFNASSVSIFVTNREWEITLANQHMADMFRHPAEGLVGTPYPALLGAAETGDAALSMNRLLRGEAAELRMECQYQRGDGSLFWGMLSGSVIFDPLAQKEVFLGVVSDISELKAAGARIQDMAYHDMLTGLSNRMLLSDRLRQQIVLAHRQQKVFYMLFIDLDGFKQVNDQFGHARGDLVLKEVADRLRGCVRETDTIARFGGDEFVMILPLTVGSAGARNVGDKVLAALSLPYQALPENLRLSASIGIACYPHDGESEAELMLAADAAMYAAKNEGKSRLSFHAPGLPEPRAASFTAC